MEKIFLSKYSKLKLEVGDVIREENRFNKSFVLWQITKIENNWCRLLVLASNTCYIKGKSYDADISAHYGGQNTAYLTYYIPAGKVLFGSKDIL